MKCLAVQFSTDARAAMNAATFAARTYAVLAVEYDNAKGDSAPAVRAEQLAGLGSLYSGLQSNIIDQGAQL